MWTLERMIFFYSKIKSVTCVSQPQRLLQREQMPDRSMTAGTSVKPVKVTLCKPVYKIISIESVESEIMARHVLFCLLSEKATFHDLVVPHFCHARPWSLRLLLPCVATNQSTCCVSSCLLHQQNSRSSLSSARCCCRFSNGFPSVYT